VLSAARAPEGRFHRSGQKALYASLTAQGAGVALGYYLRDDAPQTMVTMQLQSKRIVDATDPQIASQLGFDIADTAWPWQDDRRENICPRTWTVSDRAREIGADGMNLRSSQRPHLHHIVLFHWNINGSTSIIRTNMSVPWPPMFPSQQPP
jgi:RES domain-containing protein